MNIILIQVIHSRVMKQNGLKDLLKLKEFQYCSKDIRISL